MVRRRTLTTNYHRLESVARNEFLDLRSNFHSTTGVSRTLCDAVPGSGFVHEKSPLPHMVLISIRVREGCLVTSWRLAALRGEGFFVNAAKRGGIGRVTSSMFEQPLPSVAAPQARAVQSRQIAKAASV